MLTKVTITGADDNVNVASLIALSERFPFVEWGILFSASREGTPRYPSHGWRLDFQRRAEDAHIYRSAHLCGSIARDAMSGGLHSASLREYDRIQINGFVPCDGLARFANVMVPMSEVICQVRDTSALADGLEFAAGIDGSVLFDPSGGRGVETATWPLIQDAPYWYTGGIGYAGGIKPENVSDVLAAIGADRMDPFWIDMESGVRDERDRFDLGRVEAVLESCARHVRW